MSLTTRERGAYTRGAYIGVEKRATNLGGLYSGELVHGGAYLRNFTVLLKLPFIKVYSVK